MAANRNLLHEAAKAEYIRIARANGRSFTKEQVAKEAMITPAIIEYCISGKHKPEPVMPRRIRRELLQMIAQEKPIENLKECARICWQCSIPESGWR